MLRIGDVISIGGKSYNYMGEGDGDSILLQTDTHRKEDIKYLVSKGGRELGAALGYTFLKVRGTVVQGSTGRFHLLSMKEE